MGGEISSALAVVCHILRAMALSTPSSLRYLRSAPVIWQVFKRRQGREFASLITLLYGVAGTIMISHVNVPDSERKELLKKTFILRFPTSGTPSPRSVVQEKTSSLRWEERNQVCHISPVVGRSVGRWVGNRKKLLPPPLARREHF